MTYHICLFNNQCLFNFVTLQHLDFFFAQYFIIYLAIYVVHWTPKWRWLEWTLVFVGGFVIAILIIALPGELYVQAGIVFVCLLGIAVYWIIYANTCGEGRVPPYDWNNFALAIGLIAISTTMFSIQNVVPQLYWAAHSIWHATAALGFHFWLQIKQPPTPDPKYVTVATKIKWP